MMLRTRSVKPSITRLSRCTSRRTHTKQHLSKKRKHQKIVDHTKTSSIITDCSSFTDSFQLNTKQFESSIITTHTPISFSQRLTRRKSRSDIYDIIERKKRFKRCCGYRCCCCCCPLCAYVCLFGCILLTIGIAALLVRLLSISNSTSSTNPVRRAILNVNLIMNGNAETGPCQTSTGTISPTGWNYNGTISQMYYNSTASSQKVTPEQLDDRGKCYFTGQSSALTSMWQTINLTNYVDPYFIDIQGVQFNFSAWIGGYIDQDDNARASLSFFDQLNQPIGSGVTIGPVLAIDRVNITLLLFRQTQGWLPAGTRFITVTVTITRVFGSISNGDIDNIVLTLYL